MLESGFSFRGKSPIPYLLLFECKYWTFIQPFYLCVIQLYNITNYSNVTGAYFSKNLQTLPVQLYIRFFPYLTIYFWSVYIITIYVASIICCSPMQAAYFVYIMIIYSITFFFQQKSLNAAVPKILIVFWLSQCYTFEASVFLLCNSHNWTASNISWKTSNFRRCNCITSHHRLALSNCVSILSCFSLLQVILIVTQSIWRLKWVPAVNHICVLRNPDSAKVILYLFFS